MKYFFNYSSRKHSLVSIILSPGPQTWLSIGACALRRRDTYVLDDHDEEGELDGESLLRLNGARDEVGRHVRSHDLEHGRLNVRVGQPLNVTVAHLLIPNLQGL